MWNSFLRKLNHILDNRILLNLKLPAKSRWSFAYDNKTTSMYGIFLLQDVFVTIILTFCSSRRKILHNVLVLQFLRQPPSWKFLLCHSYCACANTTTAEISRTLNPVPLYLKCWRQVLLVIIRNRRRFLRNLKVDGKIGNYKSQNYY